MIQYCKNCILPNTRPNITLDSNGYCNASTIESKTQIDWEERKLEFQKLVRSVKLEKKNYDCVIPVSGGKDSTWQVIKALEYDLKPLCVTWKSPGRNNLGQNNLDNLIRLGVDHIDFTVNPNVEKVFILKAFKKFGNPLIPMHMALHAIPLQIACNYKIPLILWGENSAYEYGGDEHLMGMQLNHEWLKKYGVTNGTTSEDWVDEDLSASNLEVYHWPTDEDQKISNVKAVFLGYYFKWDPIKTYEIAARNGFKSNDVPKTGYYSFADIDDSFLITIHHWMKWYKFGFTRLWDNLSLEIRNKRISRPEAIEIISKIGPEVPTKEINSFIKFLEISKIDFENIVSNFRNTNIWKKNENNNWYIKNFLIKNWNWEL